MSPLKLWKLCRKVLPEKSSGKKVKPEDKKLAAAGAKPFI
jgi:hypothetical protein